VIYFVIDARFFRINAFQFPSPLQQLYDDMIPAYVGDGKGGALQRIGYLSSFSETQHTNQHESTEACE
jgi:hypothetical protein